MGPELLLSLVAGFTECDEADLLEVPLQDMTYVNNCVSDGQFVACEGGREVGQPPGELAPEGFCVASLDAPSQGSCLTLDALGNEERVRPLAFQIVGGSLFVAPTRALGNQPEVLVYELGDRGLLSEPVRWSTCELLGLRGERCSPEDVGVRMTSNASRTHLLLIAWAEEGSGPTGGGDSVGYIFGSSGVRSVDGLDPFSIARIGPDDGFLLENGPNDFVSVATSGDQQAFRVVRPVSVEWLEASDDLGSSPLRFEGESVYQMQWLRAFGSDVLSASRVLEGAWPPEGGVVRLEPQSDAAPDWVERVRWFDRLSSGGGFFGLNTQDDEVYLEECFIPSVRNVFEGPGLALFLDRRVEVVSALRLQLPPTQEPLEVCSPAGGFANCKVREGGEEVPDGLGGLGRLEEAEGGCRSASGMVLWPLLLVLLLAVPRRRRS